MAQCARIVLLAAIALGCHRAAPVTQPDVPPRRQVIPNSVSAEFLRDTAAGAVHYTGARTFDLQQAGMRDTLRVIVNAQRKLWEMGKPSEYRFLLRVQCFCPGQQGWVLIEARAGQPLRAWRETGQPAAVTEWFVFNIDTLYSNLLRSAEHVASVQVTFDERWHFPAYVGMTASARLPDTWSIMEVRGFRPL